MNTIIEKAGKPVGTVSHRSDGDYKKQSDGSWEKVTEPKENNEQVDPQTETKEFKEWFGDSKVVDENGDPLVVYHGTNKDFKEFAESTIGNRTDDGFAGRGFYFSSDPDVASSYAGEGDDANILPAYLKISNPYDFSGQNFYEVVQSKGGRKDLLNGQKKTVTTGQNYGVSLWFLNLIK